MFFSCAVTPSLHHRTAISNRQARVPCDQVPREHTPIRAAPCQRDAPPLSWRRMPVLESDSVIRLPSLTVLRASAGSGKTFTLTERYVQFLLSPLIPKNDLANILAITFSHNASREMRENVLEWLKLLAFRDAGRLAEIGAIVQGGDETAGCSCRPGPRPHLRAVVGFPGADHRQLHVHGLPRLGAGLRLQPRLRDPSRPGPAPGLRVHPLRPRRPGRHRRGRPCWTRQPGRSSACGRPTIPSPGTPCPPCSPRCGRSRKGFPGSTRPRASTRTVLPCAPPRRACAPHSRRWKGSWSPRASRRAGARLSPTCCARHGTGGSPT